MTDIPKTIGLVDFSHGLTVQFKSRANDSGPNDCGQAFLDQLAEFQKMCGKIVLCLDSGPYWRKEIFPGYKAGREREAEYGPIYAWTLDRAKRYGYQIASAPSEEGDDVIAALALAYSELGCRDVRIFGADKDTFQCINESVRVFTPAGGGQYLIRDAVWVKKKAFGIDWEQEKLEGIWPKDVALALAINGDTSDKIPGVKGIGWKGAAKLINNYKTLEGMANACAGAIEAAKMTDKPPAAFWKNYAAGMAELPKWLKLTTLNTAAKLDKSPLEYLEVLPQLPLTDGEEISDADDSSFIGSELDEAEFVDAPTAEELEAERVQMEQQRTAMAAALPVGRSAEYPVSKVDGFGPEPVDLIAEVAAKGPAPTAAEAIARDRAAGIGARPIIGADPNAKAELERQFREREVARMNTTPAGDKPTAEEIDATQRRIAEGNAAERERNRNRHGVVTPDPTVMDPKAAPAAADPPASAPPKAPVAAGHAGPAVASSAAGQAAATVVPSSQGPQKKPLEIEETALALRPEAPSWALATQPASAKEMLQIATTLYNSKYFTAFGSEKGNFAIISYGRELGLGYMQALMSFYDVNGRPFMGAHALRGLILNSSVCEYFICVESTAEKSTWITRRRGWPEGREVPYTYTLAEAHQSGITKGVNRHNWETKPRSMVDKTCSTRLGRQVYADIIGGLHAQEESE